MSKALITSRSKGGDPTTTNPAGPYHAGIVVDCSTGTAYTAHSATSAPAQVGAVVNYVEVGATTTKCGTVTSWTTATAGTSYNAIIEAVSTTCGGCSTGSGSATMFRAMICAHNGAGGSSYGEMVSVYDPSGMGSANGDFVKISKSGYSMVCAQLRGKVTDAPAYNSSTDWSIAADSGWSSCNDCLGVSTRPTLYKIAFISPCGGGTSVIARIGDKEVNLGSVVKYVTTSGSSSTVACGTVTNIQWDSQSAAIIADGVADCSSCDDSTSGSDDWHTVWQCDSDIIEIVFNKDSVSGVAVDGVVKYNKDGDSTDYCGTVTSNAIAGTYSSGDLYIASTETDCSSCASGGGSNFTITPCDGGSDIIADDSNGENPSVGDVVGYSDGVSDEECGTISGTTSSSASYTIDSSGWIDCDDCGTGGGGGGEGGGGP